MNRSKTLPGWVIQVFGGVIIIASFAAAVILDFNPYLFVGAGVTFVSLGSASSAYEIRVSQRQEQEHDDSRGKP